MIMLRGTFYNFYKILIIYMYQWNSESILFKLISVLDKGSRCKYGSREVDVSMGVIGQEYNRGY